MPEPEANTGSNAGELSLGDRLRSARKARALSLEQVAESLHLDESIILALENERYETFGAAVFVRGHLRAYARLVGLPIDSVLDAYREADPDNETEPVVTREPATRSVSVNPVIWGFWGLVVLVGLALALYVLLDDTVDQKPRPAAEPGVDTPLVEKPRIGKTTIESTFREPAVTEPMSESVSESRSEPGRASDDIVTPPEPNAEPTGSLVDAAASTVGPDDLQSESGLEAEPQTGTMRLSLHFQQESWVEISDANSRLLFGLQTKGKRRELSGEPPFQLLLGNARGVELKVNDRPYSVPIVGTRKVARFEIQPGKIE